MNKHTFSNRLISWYAENGRHNLPWQKNPTPYRVWISEIMLQQTQVTTVIPYYQRFMDTFPTLKSLALTSEDTVLSHWSGLGYYARARNLHKAAQIVYFDKNNLFPDTVTDLSNLPGIGRSTAGAILSFSKKQYAVILDGNVKRVLTRTFAIDTPINKAATVNLLWDLATELTPKDQAHHYNQPIMDLGATVCTRTKPACELCPFHQDCIAFQAGNPTNYPKKIAKKPKPIRQTRMLIIHNNKGEVLLYKRPSNGVWGGLWSFPEQTHKEEVKYWSHQNKRFKLNFIDQLEKLTHHFTHFTLIIDAVLVSIKTDITFKDSQFAWYHLSSELPGGIAAPVNNLLNQLREIK